MIKVVTTLKKKAGMSTEDFRAYYETHHRLIGEKYLCMANYYFALGNNDLVFRH